MVARAELIRAGGAMVLDGLLTHDWFEALRDEGLGRRAAALEQRKEDADPGEWRTGNPSRFLATAESGPILEEIYADPGLIGRLEGLTGGKLKPSGGRGSYSYYDRPGHYLGLHRDIRTCDVTLITCLDRHEGETPSGALRLYPKALRADLDEIGAETPHRDVNMLAGQSVVLLGGYIPHEVLPAVDGFSRTIAVLCFALTAPGGLPCSAGGVADGA